MRKLMWFAVGFVSACAAGVYLLSGSWYWLIGLFCLLGILAMLFIQTRLAKITAVALLGCLVGFAWLGSYESFYLSAAKVCDGETKELTIVAADYSYAPAYGQAFDGYTELDGKRYQVRCYLNEDVSIVPGQIVEGSFRIRYTVGEEKEHSYHQGKGIFLLAMQDGDITLTDGQLRLRDYPAIWRHKILSLIQASFPEDTAAFAKALLLGETSELTYAQNRAFQVSGLRHVVAVSGLHVSILFAIVYMAFGRRRVWNTLIGIPLLVLFAAIAGFTPSIVRACIMQILMLLALLTDKEYDPPTALAFAVLALLAVNPMAITSVSLQLSVGCMIGIFAFSEPIKNYLQSFGKLKEKCKGDSAKAKLLRWFTGSVSVTLSAMAITTPLCAIYFGMVSLIGILANLLTLWVISFAFYGIIAAAITTMIWVPLGQALAWVIAWPIRYVLMVSGLLAKFPLAAVYTDSVYIVIWLILAYTLLIAFFFTGKKHPGVTAGSIVTLLAISIGLSWLEPAMDDTRVSVIDVGQGQSILLQHEKTTYLVDCGGEHVGMTADTVANFLLSQGIFRLDGVILTHYDSDHAGSVMELLSVVDANRIYMPDVLDSNGIRQRIQERFKDKIFYITDRTELDISGGKITLYPGITGENDNESSLCILFQPQTCDILITGDRNATGERALLKEAQLPKLELLVAGHHGSHLATSLELLMATRPEVVAISVGADNRYGHPREEVLDRLSRFGCEIYRTDLQGTIIFRR